MSGTLYVISTPIGNLEDLTFRALRILKEVSVIAAEDTRRTQKLCSHYGIDTPLTSYHDFNKEDKTAVLLKRMEEGSSVALVSDAGTPLISDPGFYLTSCAISRNLPVVPIPGPSAFLTALTASGLPTHTFVFHGFLPRKSTARTRLIQNLQEEPRTMIFFESPHRIEKTLQALQEHLGTRKVVLARELTKIHEEFLRGTAGDILQMCQHHTFRGEITLVVEGKAKKSNTRKDDRKSDEGSHSPSCLQMNTR